MSLSPTARPTLDQLEGRDVATIGLLSSLFHGVSLLDCKPEPVKPCVQVSLPKCDIKVELPKCDIKVELPKCEPPKKDNCEPKKDDCTPPKAPPVVCEPKKEEPKCEPKKDDCGPKAPPVACEPKKDDNKCDDKKDVKKDCFTPADLVCKIVNTKVQVVKGFSLFGKC